MSLRLTPTVLGSRASGYNNRVMVYAHRRQKSRYLAPKQPHCRSPLANKSPEEYGNNWDPRSGVEWYYRLRQRNHYRHWPWARWTDDPVRHHADNAHHRTLSALSGAAADGMPEWDVYAEVGRDYKTPPHFPLTYAAPFIHAYTGKIWSEAQLRAHLDTIAEGTGLKTIGDVAANIGALRYWGERQRRSTPTVVATTEKPSVQGGLRPVVPRGVLQHVELVAKDIVAQHNRRAYRAEQHQSGVLRTREMERYYALPHLRGPAMPQKLAQPSGAYPWGKYTLMLGDIAIHPLQTPDARFTENMYPR